MAMAMAISFGLPVTPAMESRAAATRIVSECTACTQAAMSSVACHAAAGGHLAGDPGDPGGKFPGSGPRCRSPPRTAAR
jgi:hypothetical protein